MGCQYFSPADGGADTFTVAMPKLTFGRGCLGETGRRAATRGLKRVALITDPFLAVGPYVDTVKRSLTDNNIDVSTSHRLEKEAGGRVACIVPD